MWKLFGYCFCVYGVAGFQLISSKNIANLVELLPFPPRVRKTNCLFSVNLSVLPCQTLGPSIPDIGCSRCSKTLRATLPLSHCIESKLPLCIR